MKYNFNGMLENYLFHIHCTCLNNKLMRDYLSNKQLIKENATRKHSPHDKIAASVLLKPFISGNERYHTTDVPYRINT